MTTPPCYEQGTILNKVEFRDAISIRYGLSFRDLGPSCVCSRDMTIDHAMSCPAGGYPTARHNEVRDLLAEILSETCPEVEIEPVLTPLEGEVLHGRMASTAQEARLDIKARGFWTRQQDAFFDVRVTHPKASLLSRSEIASHLRMNEGEKKNRYAQRVVEVERGSFTPLVFSTEGQCGEH